MDRNGHFDLTREAYDFVHSARDETDSRELARSFGTRVRALGFDHFVCLQLAGPGGEIAPQELFGEWDRQWEARYVGQRHYKNDPVFAEMFRRTEPFAWSDIAKTRPLARSESVVLGEARDYGAYDGFVTPFRNVDGSAGNVTLFAKHCDLSPDARTSLHVMSLYFSGAARRLREGSVQAGTELLSPREREIVRQLAQGLTQNDVADRLKISSRTVETLVSRARLRLGVTTTAQLCVEAVRLGAVRL